MTGSDFKNDIVFRYNDGKYNLLLVVCDTGDIDRIECYPKYRPLDEVIIYPSDWEYCTLVRKM